nr:odorant receptor 25 [Holotrichia parallela]
MSSFKRFLSLLKSKFLGNDVKLSEDGAKYTIIFSQIITDIINIWPEKFSTSTTVCFSVTFVICILQEISLFVFLITSVEDVDSLTKVLASMSIVLQSMVKGSTFYYKAEEMNEVIKIIRHEFWPSNIMGKDLDCKIRGNSKILLSVLLVQYVFAVAFLLFYVILPLIQGTKQLPHTSWYPFDWSATPAYEILYCLQAYITVYFNENVVCAYDSLYCSICANCVAQFRLLSEAVKHIGTGREDEIAGSLLKIPGVNYRATLNVEDYDERRLLVICIRHHQKLIEVTDQLNKIFGNGHLVQVFASVLGSCTSIYRITTKNGLNDLTFLISYYMAHVVQLFEYCALSNELSYWSTCLSVTAFQCFWYRKKYSDIRGCLSLVIMRSQRSISMNGLGLFELDYVFFMSVMRFTFSLYTFLSRFTE